MKYSKHSLNQKRKERYNSKPLAYREGIFLMPNNMWIARVKENGNFKTISQHKTQREALESYNNFYENK